MHPKEARPARLDFTTHLLLYMQIYKSQSKDGADLPEKSIVSLRTRLVEAALRSHSQ